MPPNTRNVVLGRATVYVGNLAGSPVRIGEVFREAVRRQAAAVVVAHNHPSGDPSPSGEDLRITAELAEAGRLLDIELLDHLVIGHGRWVSLRAAGRSYSTPSSGQGDHPVEAATGEVDEVDLAVLALAERADLRARTRRAARA